VNTCMTTVAPILSPNLATLPQVDTRW